MEYGIEVWHPKLTRAHQDKLQVIQNKGLRQILGAVQSTPIMVLHAEAGILPIDLRFQLIQQLRALRSLTRVQACNPIRAHVATQDQRSPIRHMHRILEEANIDLSEQDIGGIDAPWREETVQSPEETVQGPKEEDDITKVRKGMVRIWQARYNNDTTGRSFREVVPQIQLVVKTPKLSLQPVFSKYKRSVLSHIVRFRCNHTYFNRRGVLHENVTCTCGETPTVEHIIKECNNLMVERQVLLQISPELELKKLLGTKPGLKAMAQYIEQALLTRKL